MKKKESFLKKLTENLVDFIETENLSIGHEACQWRCRETVVCPYEEHGLKMNCRVCISQYLEQEEDTIFYNRRIHFTDVAGKLRFILPDGQFIKLNAANGETAVILCKYVSEEEAEFDGNRMTIQAFIKEMDQKGIIIEPLKK